MRALKHGKLCCTGPQAACFTHYRLGVLSLPRVRDSLRFRRFGPHKSLVSTLSGAVISQRDRDKSHLRKPSFLKPRTLATTIFDTVRHLSQLGASRRRMTDEIHGLTR